MAQLLMEDEDSMDTEELFINETAKLARIIAEQKENAFVNECYVVTTKGVGTSRASVPHETLTDQEELAARNLGRLLSVAVNKHEKVLIDEFDAQMQDRSIWDLDYNLFSSICSNILRSTLSTVSNRWEQALLVFAGYMHLRGTLQGNEQGSDVLNQNYASYVGQYLNSLGFQSWISAQGGWQNVGEIAPGTDSSLVCPPEGTAV